MGSHYFLDKIRIDDFHCECIIGIYPFEREKPQLLSLDITLHVETEKAAISNELHHSVDYAAVTEKLAFILKQGKFELIETAAHVLALSLLAAYRDQILAVDIAIEKPQALQGEAFPSLTISRDAAWASTRLKNIEQAYGKVDILYQQDELGIYLLQMLPGKSLPVSIAQQANCLDQLCIVSPHILFKGEEA